MILVGKHPASKQTQNELFKLKRIKGQIKQQSGQNQIDMNNYQVSRLVIFPQSLSYCTYTDCNLLVDRDNDFVDASPHIFILDVPLYDAETLKNIDDVVYTPALDP